MKFPFYERDTRIQRCHWSGSFRVRRKYWYNGKRRQFWQWGYDWYHYCLQESHDRRPIRRK